MNFKIVLSIILFSILSVGCQIGKEVKPSEMHPDDLPDERAFQDEFTREFLQSVEEARPGYYPFLSKTGKYELDFPAGGEIIKQAYNIDNSTFETINIGIYHKDNSFGTLFLTYYGRNKLKDIDNHLSWLEGRLGEDAHFTEYKESGKIVYLFGFQRENYKYHSAYIQNTKEHGGLEFIYSIDCQHSDCEDEHSISEDEFLKWVLTVTFLSNK
mgnify:CR=1 FL=1